MISLTTPVGRIVQGELWKPRDVTDNKGVVKLNADGTKQVSYFFALAIPKQPGHSHWAQTDWGRQIWEEGNKAHPNFAPHPNFSWKIEDGDSAIPNKKGKKNCEREGHPGHWILKFSSSFAINRTYNADGSAPLPPEAFKPGYYAQVNLTCKGNTGETPGVYLNPSMVALSGYGAEISAGPDVSEAGFGAAPLPVGASATPPASMIPAPTPGFTPPAPAIAAPGFPQPNAGGSPALPAPTSPSSPAPLAVPPNPAFLAGPGGVAPVAAMPAPPPAAAVPQMTAAAGGATYEQFIAQGWTADQMRAQGFLA